MGSLIFYGKIVLQELGKFVLQVLDKLIAIRVLLLQDAVCGQRLRMYMHVHAFKSTLHGCPLTQRGL